MFENYCRLCAREKLDLFPVFDARDEDKSLVNLIACHLRVTILEREFLPRNVCQDCLETFKIVTSFFDKVRNAQIQLNNMALSSHENPRLTSSNTNTSTRHLEVCLERISTTTATDIKDEMISLDYPENNDFFEKLESVEQTNASLPLEYSDSIDISCDIKYENEFKDFTSSEEKQHSDNIDTNGLNESRKEEKAQLIFSARAARSQDRIRNYLNIDLTLKQLSHMFPAGPDKESLRKLGRKIFKKILPQFNASPKLDWNFEKLQELIESLELENENEMRNQGAEAVSDRSQINSQTLLDNNNPGTEISSPSFPDNSSANQSDNSPVNEEMAGVPELDDDMEMIESASVNFIQPRPVLKVPKVILTRLHKKHSNLAIGKVTPNDDIETSCSQTQNDSYAIKFVEPAEKSKAGTVKRGIQCCRCSQYFVSKDKLYHHIREVHEDESMACAHCSFATFQKFKYRMTQHLKEVHDKSYECRDCGKLLGKRSKLRLHYRNEHMTLPTPIKCDVCKESFNQRYLYRVHIKNEHTLDTFWTCPRCPEQFPQKHKLDIHMCKNHSNQLNKCPVAGCSFRALHKYGIKQHCREVHEKRFICPICNKAESKNSRLLSHMKNKHTKKKSYDCPICCASYHSTKWYNSHMLKYHRITNKG